MELQDIITSVVAIVGMVLGIYNFVWARFADRVRLRVIPKASRLQGTDQNGREVYLSSRTRFDLAHPTASPELSLNVINLSKFAVTFPSRRIGVNSANRSRFRNGIKPTLGMTSFCAAPALASD